LNTTSIVLAGGRSSRLGKEKHTEEIAGESLIERTIGSLSLISTEILIVISNRQSKSTFASYAEAKTVVDLYPGKGPLVGIYTGLVHSSNLYNLAVACDMPFLNLDLLRHMIALSPRFDVVMPRIDNLIEPLHAVYSKNCLVSMKSLIEKGSLKISDLLDSVSVRYVEKVEIDKFDPKRLSFFNINTKADLEKAQLLASRDITRDRHTDRRPGQ
jgi:molybdopterin-guanine dinucleotide biosynthesis protein A